jgi:hypothetical protein
MILANFAAPPEETPGNHENDGKQPGLRGDLQACPRCGIFIGTIIWGQTNCPNCGLHFECC